ncbi:hypothetical protein NDU88_008045 [Pleurodeles waltl]|uniref:Secreted protein n=1 Tax=Pleurodeles waltl TaxID=8319 RepID=A0AAV7QME0_PLEWA|nr:hypothetical protein NDU88_008045 [Pleurodeles waltl]
MFFLLSNALKRWLFNRAAARRFVVSEDIRHGHLGLCVSIPLRRHCKYVRGAVAERLLDTVTCITSQEDCRVAAPHVYKLPPESPPSRLFRQQSIVEPEWLSTHS